MSFIVEGAIFDIEGSRPGYVRFSGGRIVETGRLGTDSTRGRLRRIRGIVAPAPVNAHTHLGDAVSSREPPSVPFAELVGPPDGFKFRLLAGSTAAQKRTAIRSALGRMEREATAATIDFREEGREGIALLRQAARGRAIEVVALGRPLTRPVEADELDELLRVADGIGLPSAKEEDETTRRRVANACRRSKKRYALHASEEAREPVDRYLSPRPDLLVHLTYASRSDLEAVREANCAVAVCPRSNAWFARAAPLARLERSGVRVLLGTDNAMLNAPSIWRELGFAYLSSRLAGAPVSPAFLARAALVEPWRWLGRPRAARIEAGGEAVPVVLRLPPDDPAYQIVSRTTEQVIVRPAHGARSP